MRFGLVCSLMFVAVVGCTKSKPNTPPGSPSSGPSSTVTEPPPPLPTKTAKVLTPKATFASPLKVDEFVGQGMLLSDDGTRLVLLFNAKSVAHIYDLTAAPKKLHEVPCTGLKALSPDGKKLVCSRPGSVYGGIIDTDTNALVCSFKEDVGFVTFLNPETIVSLRRDTTGGKQTFEIKTLSAKNGEKQKDHVAPAYPPENTHWNHHLVNGKELVIGSGSTGKFTFWDVVEGRLIREVTLANITPNRGNSNFKVSADGKWLKCEERSSPHFYDTKTGAEANKADKSLYYFSSLMGEFIYGRDAFLSYRSAGMGALASDPKVEGGYTVLDVKQPTVKYVLPNKGSAFAISGNGKVLVTQDESGEVRLWDLTQTQ